MTTQKNEAPGADAQRNYVLVFRCPPTLDTAPAAGRIHDLVLEFMQRVKALGFDCPGAGYATTLPDRDMSVLVSNIEDRIDARNRRSGSRASGCYEFSDWPPAA